MSEHESPEERAQRSVERMFPLVSRFLARDPSRLPVYGPTDPFGDEEHTPDVIVRVDYLMSREQLTTVLGVAWAEIAADRDPESLASVEVRHEVEAWLSVQALHELGLQMERDAQRVFPPEQQRVMQVLAEAIAKAYPPRREPEQLPVQRPEYGDGTVTLDTLDHGRITIDEPAWCRGHEGELVGPRSEVSHEGPEIAAAVAEVPLMRANLTHAPLLEIEQEPHPLVYVEALEAASYDADGLRELVATGRAFLDQLEAMAGQLDALAEGGQP